ncbi:MAG: T9SS type A sorting domain-containing protein [Bacteroidetes bacterium]|nr:T9SS type A sorting domain-containing protein [Bacteroidota bacterium]
MRPLIRIFFIATLWLCISSAEAQYFSKRYPFRLGSFFNNVLDADTSLYIVGAAVDSDRYYFLKPYVAEITYEGDIKRDRFYELDTPITYQPDNHCALLKNDGIHISGGGGPNNNGELGFYSHISLDSFALTIQKYTDTSYVNFSFQSGINLPSGSRVFAGTYARSANAVGYFLLKTDVVGNEQWRRYYPFTANWQLPGTMIFLSNGNLLIGVERIIAPANWTFASNDLMEIDTMGNRLSMWEDKVNIGKTFKPFGMTELDDHSIVYCTSYVDTNIQTGSGLDALNKGIIVCMDSARNKAWQIISGNAWYNTKLNQVKQLRDGNLLIVGRNDSVSEYGEPRARGWIVKINRQGGVIWDKKYSGTDSARADNELFDFVELDNGDIIATGYCVDYTLPRVNTQGWLLRIDSNGCFNDHCMASINETEDDEALTIYPVPTEDMIHIVSPYSLGASYTIYDVVGQKILSGAYPGHEQTLSLRELPTGLYFFDLSAEGHHSIRRIVKE